MVLFLCKWSLLLAILTGNSWMRPVTGLSDSWQLLEFRAVSSQTHEIREVSSETQEIREVSSEAQANRAASSEIQENREVSSQIQEIREVSSQTHMLAELLFSDNKYAPHECGMTLAAHPFYVSVTDINHDEKQEILEVAIKIFTDDFENTLKQVFNKKVDLINPIKDNDSLDNDKMIELYISRQLLLKVNGKPVQMRYLGHEREMEAVWSYFEIPGVSKVNQMEISNGLLYDFISQQINLIHATVNGKRRSAKLSYPDKNVLLKWQP